MAIQVIATLIVLVIVLPAYIIYKPPIIVIDYFRGRFPDVLFRISTSEKVVALTIDDAPSRHTTQILDVLKANNAFATFFVIGGQVPGREDVMDEIVRQGHELGNHAMHDEPSINLSNDQLSEEIVQVDALIAQAYKTIGYMRSGRYFRPGSGIFSRRIVNIADNLGYLTVLGSIYPHDPFIKYWWVNAWHVLSMLRPGAIIICHDRRSWTVPMLQKVLPEMKRRGYKVVTLSDLLERIKSSSSSTSGGSDSG